MLQRILLACALAMGLVLSANTAEAATVYTSSYQIGIGQSGCHNRATIWTLEVTWGRGTKVVGASDATWVFESPWTHDVEQYQTSPRVRQNHREVTWSLDTQSADVYVYHVIAAVDWTGDQEPDVKKYYRCQY